MIRGAKYPNAFRFKNYFYNDRQYYFLLLIIFVVLSAIGMIHHEMWRDELEAWLIARDSSSIADLFSNLTYTGHPFLWYLGLYLLAKVTHDPVVIQIFHLVIITGVIYVFLYFSPFNKLQKTLFCFGYFPLYEYGVISRGYSLGILFVFMFCALYCQPRRNYLLSATVLALASQTNIYSLIISFVLALVLFVEELFSNVSGHSKKLLFKPKIALGIIIYLFGMLTAVIQIIPASSALSNGELGSTINQTVQQESYSFITIIRNYLASSLEFGKLLTGIWRSYIPIPDSGSPSPWATNLLTDNQQFPTIGTVNTAPLIALVLSLGLFCLFIAIFARFPKVLFVYVSGTVAIYLFGFVAKIPALRHNGHLFILLIVCYWLFFNSLNQESKPQKLSKSKLIRFINKRQAIALTTILCIQLYAGIKLYRLDLIQPFSKIDGVVQFIKNNQLEDSLIVGTSDLTVFPLSAWLDREIYYPEIADFGTFTVWTPKSTSRNSDITESEIIEQADELKQDTSQKLILVTDKQLQTNIKNSDIKLIASFQEQSLLDEEYFIYLME